MMEMVQFVLLKFIPVSLNVKTIGELKIVQKTIQISIVKTHSTAQSVITLGIVVMSLKFLPLLLKNLIPMVI
jgi:hypothetical protein